MYTQNSHLWAILTRVRKEIRARTGSVSVWRNLVKAEVWELNLEP